MAAIHKLTAVTGFHPLVGAHSFVLGQVAWHYRPPCMRKPATTQSERRALSTDSPGLDRKDLTRGKNGSEDAVSDTTKSQTSDSGFAGSKSNVSLPPGWEDNPSYSSLAKADIIKFSDLPHRFFGYNQHIKINADFKESLRQILWQFRAPIRYAFAYGSGVFGQTSSSASGGGDFSPHPHPPKAVEEWQKGGAKVIDFIFGVSHTQHWHSLNLAQHPGHYSGLKYLPYSSAAISRIQDRFGAGIYFNPFINVNGVMIKYGVVNLDTLAQDLSGWNTLYLAGRLQKPVKILRDDARIRLANQYNLLAALRTALLMLPEKFTERQLYETVAGLSYMGDPRMLRIPGVGAGENPSKVSNIVGAQLPGFRQLYVPLIENLPNVQFTDPRTPGEEAWEKEDAIRHPGSNVELADDVLGGRDGLQLTQDMSSHPRGNMVRRLPKQFRQKLYFQYQKKFQIPGSAFDDILTRSDTATVRAGGGEADHFGKSEAGTFEERVAAEGDLAVEMARCVSATVRWPATTQTVKGFFTAGAGRAWRYYMEKRKKGGAAPRESSTEKKED